MEKHQTHRKFGLDIVRSIAILFVVFGHAATIFNPLIKIPVFRIFMGKLLAIAQILAFVGVELFFVLSGYLISKIIYHYFLRKDFKFNTIFSFWIRRWLRTLPNYYLLLIINIILFIFILKYFNFDWRYLFFLQNIWQPHPVFFKEAWSLAIEEWFYILLPILLFILIKLNQSLKRAMLITCLVLIAISFSVKVFYAFHFHYNNFDEYFRKIVLLRFDNLAIGILCYFVQLHYSNFWHRNKKLLFFIGIAIVTSSIVGFYYLAYQHNFYGYHHNTIVYHYCNIFWLSILGIGIACIFPLMENLSTTKHKFIHLFFTTTAKISYAMYLLNIPIYFLLFRYLLKVPSTISSALIAITIYYSVLYTASYLLYHFFELRILTYRDKYFPNKH
ncbi:MAG: acyltransferase [Chitinophagales bacterium]|nr:acyltransferase [Chitinophagales bacterium]